MQAPILKEKRPFWASFSSDILFDGVDGTLFQPGHLGLGDAHLSGDFHLGLALEKAQVEDALFPL